MLRTGEWLSISILGLVVLFIFVSFSFFNFLIGPNSTGPRTTVEPSSAFIQIIFISIAPAIALSFFVNALSEGSKLSYLLIIAAGISLIIGMIYISQLMPLVDDIELPEWITYTPIVFTIFGGIMISIGLISYRKNKKRISTNYHGQM